MALHLLPLCYDLPLCLLVLPNIVGIDVRFGASSMESLSERLTAMWYSHVNSISIHEIDVELHRAFVEIDFFVYGRYKA